jgi:hypothetical protein
MLSSEFIYTLGAQRKIAENLKLQYNKYNMKCNNLKKWSLLLYMIVVFQYTGTLTVNCVKYYRKYSFNLI